MAIIQLTIIMVMQLLLLLQFISSSLCNLQPYDARCNFTNFSLFCPANDSNSVCYFCKDGQAICNELPNSILRCREGSIVLLDTYCLIYDPPSSKIYAGQCPYGQPQKNVVDVIYKRIPRNFTELKCKESLQRSGILCGECEPDHYPLAYSYNLTCVSCPHGHLNWLKVLPALFVPLTLFSCLVIVLKINVLSSHLHGFVFYSQAVSAPAFGRVFFNHPFIQHSDFSLIFKSIGSFYSVWNLDIFLSFSPGICLPLKSRNILWLDLAIGTYPLFVIAITYFIIQLYKNNIGVFVCLWNLAKRVFSKSWGISSTLIDAFATFLVLSSVKILTASLDLLASTPVYELSYESLIGCKWRLYYDPEVRLFKGNYHTNFYISISVVLIFIALPFLILLLYPFQFFQKCLNRTPCNWNALHTFMDAFQGCYKNGTEHGSYDFRWFSALFCGSRVALVLLYAFTYNSMYLVLAAIIIVVIVLLLIIFQPFRPEVSMYSYTTTMFLMLLSLWYVSLFSYNLTSSGDQVFVTNFFYTVIAVVTLLPVLCFCLIVVLKIKQCSQLACLKIKSVLQLVVYNPS